MSIEQITEERNKEIIGSEPSPSGPKEAKTVGRQKLSRRISVLNLYRGKGI